MSEPFLGEIRLMPFGFAPRNWLQCNGQILAISTNTALFSLLGTTYGGDGATNFALPDLRGRAPMHSNGNPHLLGELGGEPFHTLSSNEIPQHSHSIGASTSPATSTSPSGNVFAAHRGGYAEAANVTMGPSSLGGGNSNPHENRPPFLVLNFCICAAGVYPSRD